jgi:uncharacterized protein
MSNDPGLHILVVAQSARMLAQLGVSAGYIPLVIDCYGDQDTLAYAEDCQRIASMAEADFSPALDYFLGRYPVTDMVYGSGFERYPDSLRLAGIQMKIMGNQPDVFAGLHDKAAFFSLLSALQIPYPEVSFHPPEDETGWLVKPMVGHGGVGIKRYRKTEDVEQATYWQKYQAGVPHSVLFLADGKRCVVIGFNRQWTTAVNAENEFCFSGIINSAGLTDGQKQQISNWVSKLVAELSLRGLNSLDFIQASETSYVLEINPRLPASMQLYDADLFVWHIKACQGELLDYQPKQVGFTGYQIIYAKQDTQIPHGFAWPEGIADIPFADSIIGAGQPICSIIARGKEPDEVLKQLKLKQELITNHLDRFQTHGIQRQRQ